MKVLVYDKLISLFKLLQMAGVKRTSAYDTMRALQMKDTFVDVTKYFDFLTTSNLLKDDIQRILNRKHVVNYQLNAIASIREYLTDEQLIAIKNYDNELLPVLWQHRYKQAISYKKLIDQLAKLAESDVAAYKKAYTKLSTFTIADIEPNTLYIDYNGLIDGSGIQHKITNMKLGSYKTKSKIKSTKLEDTSADKQEHIEITKFEEAPNQNSNIITQFVEKVKQDFGVKRKIKNILITIEFDDNGE